MYICTTLKMPKKTLEVMAVMDLFSDYNFDPKEDFDKEAYKVTASIEDTGDALENIQVTLQKYAIPYRLYIDYENSYSLLVSFNGTESSESQCNEDGFQILTLDRLNDKLKEANQAGKLSALEEWVSGITIEEHDWEAVHNDVKLWQSVEQKCVAHKLIST